MTKLSNMLFINMSATKSVSSPASQVKPSNTTATDAGAPLNDLEVKSFFLLAAFFVAISMTPPFHGNYH